MTLRDERRERRARPGRCRIRDRRRSTDRRAAPAAPEDATRAPNSSARSRSHCPAADAKNSWDFVCRRASTLFSRRASWSAPAVSADLLAQQRPQPPRRPAALVERQRVVAARAVAPRRHPAGVRQRLQMPADGGLRQLEHGAELGRPSARAARAPAASGCGWRQRAPSGRRRLPLSIRISGLSVT